MSDHIVQICDRWLSDEGPQSNIVVSSRCRLARNLVGLPFTRHASAEQRAEISQRIAAAINDCETLKGYTRLNLCDLTPAQRGVLREAHLISPEMERDAHSGSVFLAPDAQISLMVNEEDHLRMQAMETGYRVADAHRQIDAVDKQLGERLPYAFSPTLGHLTACPTNTGTGLRASAMLHLPGLVVDGKVEGLIKEIANHGFAVRGFYGEGSTSAGDLYQISNEITLGKSEEEIIESLRQVIDQLIEHEREARQSVYSERRVYIEDSIWRSYATLSQARLINSNEAISLLSRLRLGIEHGLFNQHLTHQRFNRLLIEIQPAHLVQRLNGDDDTEQRDAARAEFLRARMAEILN